jgi:hypothetical protein
VAGDPADVGRCTRTARRADSRTHSGTWQWSRPRSRQWCAAHP